MKEPVNVEQELVSSYDARRFRARLRQFCRWSWAQLKFLFVIFVQRGYIAIAIGVLLIKGTLEIVWGTIPQMPGKLSESALVITVIISMFMYRQTVSLIRLRALKLKDLRDSATLSPAALKAGPSAETQDALETHWRARKAMAWITLSAFILSVYLFTYMYTVREANKTQGNTEVQVAVVVPPGFMRPAPIQKEIDRWTEKGIEDPLDYSLSTNGSLYYYSIPNEYPERIYAIVIPLNSLFILFCVMLTRSLAFAFAPSIPIHNSSPPERASAPPSSIEPKPDQLIQHKGQPSGADMGVEILDTLDDMQSMF